MFTQVLLYSVIPVATMLLGGGVAIVRKPSGNIRSLILHFAAGVVFSVVAVELLPDVVNTHAPMPLIIGFSAGFILMIIIRKATAKKESQTTKTINAKIPAGLLIAIAVDIFIDGLLLGIGFSAGFKEGVLLSIALALELLSLGMASATELNESNISKKKTFVIITILAFVFFVSAILGATLLHNLSHKALEVVLSFGLAALLFLVTEELLTEAHDEQETVWHTSAFFAGFLLFVIFGMIM